MTAQGERTRQEIVGAALRIFSRKGYFHTSIAGVLAATGLTKGGLYGHFRSKEELWEAAYERTVEVWRAIVFRGVKEIADPLERISRTVENDLRAKGGPPWRKNRSAASPWSWESTPWGSRRRRTTAVPSRRPSRACFLASGPS